MGFESIPDEMKEYKNWICWKFEENVNGKPTKVPYQINGIRADVTNPIHWSTFEDTVTNSRYFDGIGFVLSENDPYTIVDLDYTANPFESGNQIKVFESLPSYAERSVSSTGLHIICYGHVPTGRRRSHVEVYSQDRYMVMTGDVYRDVPITSCQDALRHLWAEMGKDLKGAEAFSQEQKIADKDILEFAANAANSEKFIDLFYNGNWEKYYPSQSEADFALIDIIAFYSGNAEQTQRVFLESKLGQRPKSKAQYRLNYMLNRCFDRMLPPIDLTQISKNVNAALKSKISRSKKKELTELENPYTKPPGMLGEIATYIYQQAPRPVIEIALTGALGLMAGLAGRCYNVSGTGLNQYLLLLAQTGTGKESIASGTNSLMHMIEAAVPSAKEFKGPSDIASRQALIRYMTNSHPSLYCIMGEFGKYFEQMSGYNVPSHLLGLNRTLLDIYNKSGHGQYLDGSIYSDAGKNVSPLQSPALTIIGESTPESFYKMLSEDLIADGLLPRFTIIEYTGGRPPLNDAHKQASVTGEFLERFAGFVSNCLALNAQSKAVDVDFIPEAEQLMQRYNKFCDQKMIENNKEVSLQLWNRAHIKALKLAALVAIGENPYDPRISLENAQWAINIINYTVQSLYMKFERDELQGGDNIMENKQMTTLIDIIKRYGTSSFAELPKHTALRESLHQAKIIPYAFLLNQCSRKASFAKDRLGATNAIKRVLQNACDCGYLTRIPPADLYAYGVRRGQYYAIADASILD